MSAAQMKRARELYVEAATLQASQRLMALTAGSAAHKKAASYLEQCQVDAAAYFDEQMASA